MMKGLVLLLLSCLSAVTVCRAQLTNSTEIPVTTTQAPAIPTSPWGYNQVQVINGRKNSFRSPNYYRPYYPRSTVTYHLNISNPQSQRLRVIFRFRAFDTEDCGSVCCDKLYLGGLNYCGKLSGKQVIVRTRNSVITAEFTSDGTNNFPGFLISYEAYPELTYSPDHMLCNSVTSQTRGTFISRNYPYLASNTSCYHTLKYQTTRPYTVRLRFRDFGFRGGPGCPFDYVTVPDGTSTSKYCGPDVPNFGGYFERTFYNGSFEVKAVFGVYPVAGYVIEFEAWPGFPHDRPTTAATLPPTPPPTSPFIHRITGPVFCPPTLLTATKGSFSSPRIFGKYSNSLSCYYHLDVDVGANVSVVELHMKRLDVETCGRTCSCDYLQLPSPYFEDYNNKTRLCGRFNDTTRAFLMEGRKASMLFRTDGSAGGYGFDIDYTVKPASEPECGARVSIDDILSISSPLSGYFASPGYFSKRNPGSNCSVHIINPNRRLFSLYLNSVDDKQTPGYRSTNRITMNSFYRYFGYSKVSMQYQFSGDVTMHFRINPAADLHRYPGTVFKITYAEGPLPSAPPFIRTTPYPWMTTRQSVSCPSTQLTSDRGRFLSPRFGGLRSYSDYLSCYYYLDVDVRANVSVVELNMATFDLERCGSSCGCDYLQLPAPPLGIDSNGTRLCGQYNHTTTGFLMEGRRAAMYFRTDGSVSRAGFNISYSVYPVSETGCNIQVSIDDLLAGSSSFSGYSASPGYFSKRNPGKNCSIRITNPNGRLFSLYVNSVDDKQTPGYHDTNQITVNGFYSRFFGYSKMSMQYATMTDLNVNFMINPAADLYRYPGTIFKFVYVAGPLTSAGPSTAPPFIRTTPYPWMTTGGWQTTPGPRRSLVDMLRELAWRARLIRDNLDGFANLIDQTANRAASSGLGAADAPAGLADLLT